MPDPAPTIFTRILDGEIPCHRVYEDDHVLAFLDIAPISRGHTLVISRERVAGLHELSEEAAGAMGRAVARVCRAVVMATGATAYNVLSNTGPAAGQAVMHVHVHVIPKHEGRGLGLGWKPGALDPGAAASLAASIRRALDA